MGSPRVLTHAEVGLVSRPADPEAITEMLLLIHTYVDRCRYMGICDLLPCLFPLTSVVESLKAPFWNKAAALAVGCLATHRCCCYCRVARMEEGEIGAQVNTARFSTASRRELLPRLLWGCSASVHLHHLLLKSSGA